MARLFTERPKNLNELPEDIKAKLIEERLTLATKWYKNDGHHVMLVNKEGTRYFQADRESDFYGGSSTYSQWRIKYGKVLWQMEKQPMAEYSGRSFDDYDYSWVRSSTFGTRNGYEIPKVVGKKADVWEVVKLLEIFDI